MSRPQLSVNQRHKKQKPVSGFKLENGFDVLRFSRIYNAPAIETNQRNCNYSLNMIFLQEINFVVCTSFWRSVDLDNHRLIAFCSLKVVRYHRNQFDTKAAVTRLNEF